MKKQYNLDEKFLETLDKLNSEFAEICAEYNAFWGKDLKFDEIIKKIHDWKKQPIPVTFDPNIYSSVDQVNDFCDKYEKIIKEDVKNGLEPIFHELSTHVKSKLP